MALCIICAHETVLDDIAQDAPLGQCVCLECYVRKTGTTRPMPLALRRELIMLLHRKPTTIDRLRAAVRGLRAGWERTRACALHGLSQLRPATEMMNTDWKHRTH